MEKQDKLLRRRPDLKMRYELTEADNKPVVRFIIENTGTGSLSAGDAYFHLWLPAELAVERLRSEGDNSPGERQETTDDGARKWRGFRGVISGPIFPMRPSDFITCVLREEPRSGSFEVLYAFSTAYGVFPNPEGGMERLEVKLQNNRAKP